MMNNLVTEDTITEADLDWLEELLLSRVTDESYHDSMDEGITSLSELDGYFTAIISGPVMIPPEQWLPFIWGDYELTPENDEQFERMFSIMITIMNSVVYEIMDDPENYQPVFAKHLIDDHEYLSIDEWCIGYTRGMSLCLDEWDLDNEAMMQLVTPILIFGSEEMQDLRNSMNSDELDILEQQITHNAKQIHAFWLEQRQDEMPEPYPEFDADTDELPEYENDYLKTLSEVELIGLMINDEDRVPRNVIDECASRGEKMVEILEPMAGPNEGEPFETEGRWWMRLHAVMILGLIPGEKAGLALLSFIDYLRISEDGEIQDWLAGYWPALTRNKPATVIRKLQELCEDRQVDWYTRINLVEAVIAEAKQQGGQALEASLDWLAGFISDENEDWEFRFPAAACLLHFPRERYHELLGHMVSLQDEFDSYFDKRDIEAAYSLNIDQPDWENEREPWDFYQTSAIIARNQSWPESAAWEAENEFDHEDDLFDETDGFYNWDIQQPYERETPKVGRNDPCPCGSGKKFKKCCLH